MTKSQLQPGMLAVTREGNEYLVLPDKLFGLNSHGISLSNYYDDLMISGVPNAADIMQIYSTKSGAYTTVHNPQLRTLIWQREEHEYPLYCKAKANYAELVVCFSDRTTGTVIKSNVQKYPIGYTSPHWFSHTAEQLWEQIETPIEEHKYPLYRKLEHGDEFIIVQFTDLQKGTVIDSNTDEYSIGYTSTVWKPYTDTNWIPVTIDAITESTDDTKDMSLEEFFEQCGILGDASELKDITFVMVTSHGKD